MLAVPDTSLKKRTWGEGWVIERYYSMTGLCGDLVWGARGVRASPRNTLFFGNRPPWCAFTKTRDVLLRAWFARCLRDANAGTNHVYCLSAKAVRSTKKTLAQLECIIVQPLQHCFANSTLPAQQLIYVGTIQGKPKPWETRINCQRLLPWEPHRSAFSSPFDFLFFT